jgi:hypothetical protein
MMTVVIKEKEIKRREYKRSGITQQMMKQRLNLMREG